MTTEYLILGGAGLIFALCLVYAFVPRGRAAIQQMAAPLAASHEDKFTEAMAEVERLGKAMAAKQIMEAMGASYAAEHKARVVNSIAPKDPAAPGGGSV